jgi:protein arginine kinase
MQIIDKENAMSEKIDKLWLNDNVYRSFGILKYARKISTDEMMQHISMLMLGERINVIALPESINLMNLFIISQPAMIKRIHGETEPNQRDKIRADILRSALSSVEI